MRVLSGHIHAFQRQPMSEEKYIFYFLNPCTLFDKEQAVLLCNHTAFSLQCVCDNVFSWTGSISLSFQIKYLFKIWFPAGVHIGYFTITCQIHCIHRKHPFLHWDLFLSSIHLTEKGSVVWACVSNAIGTIHILIWISSAQHILKLDLYCMSLWCNGTKAD